MSVLPLAPERVDIWYVCYDTISDPDLLAQYLRLMSVDEQVQHQQYAFEHLRREYLVTRALCRATLSLYAGVAPHEWTFVRGSHGKPEILAPQPGVPLRFNLSNTRGLVACAVACDLDVGVDVENVNRKGLTVELAEHYFSAVEVRDLLALPPERQRQRFFEYWTLKESYIKARGLGLSIPLDRFSFHLDHGGGITISFDPRLHDVGGDWQFAQCRPSMDHVMALAIRRGNRPDLDVHVRRTVPLVAEWRG